MNVRPAIVVRAVILLAMGIGLVADGSRRSDAARTLVAGVPIASELARDQADWYAIELETGQFVTVVVSRTPIDPVLTVTDPAGQTRIDMGAKEVSIVADAAGRYRIRVRADVQNAPPGQYEIAASAPQPADERHRARASADRSLSEGRALLATREVTAIRAGIEKFTAAAASFEQAGHRQGEAYARYWAGDAYRVLDTEMRAARDSLNQAIEIARAIDDRSLEARALVSYGITFTDVGERRNSLEYSERALALFEALGDRRGQSQAYTNLGVVSRDVADFTKSLDLFGRALELANAADDRMQAGVVLNLAAWTRIGMGDLSRALDDLTRAVALARAAGNRHLEFLAIQNTGVTYKELGDYRRALDAYNQALAIIRSLGLVLREAQLVNNMGNIYKAENENDKALEHFTRALEIAEREKTRGFEAIVLNNMGSAYAQKGELRTALEYIGRSREIRKAIGDRSGEASSLNQAAIAWRKLGETEQALKSLGEALEIRRRTNEALGEAEVLLNMAAVERDRGELEKARATLEAALGVTESIRATIVDGSLRATYIARVQDIYASYVDVLMRQHAHAPYAGYDRAALQAAERTRARVLLESLVEARADIREGVDPGLIERERSLQRKIGAASQRLSRSLVSRSTEASANAQKELEQLTNEYQALQAQMRTSSPRYAAFTQPEPLSATQIQQEVLDRDTVLLEFAIGGERSWLWAVTTDGMTSVELPAGRVLDERARAFYAALVARQPRKGEATPAYAQRVAAADRDVRKRADAISNMLLGAIAEDLRGRWRGKRLAIVAAGPLEYLPFAALPLPRARNTQPSERAIPLIARHEIVEAPSASVLATIRREAAQRTRPRRAVAVIADPVFERDDPRVAAARRPASTVAAADTSPTPPSTASRAIQRFDDVRGGFGLTRLPFSRDEADAIAALAGPAATMKATDFRANRATALDGTLEDYRIVHFATHGLIDAERPELSGLLLSLVNERGVAQDGFLRLQDIFNLRLNADLVVLSACQTALGKEIKGEGLVGLTRGFMYAGAPRVVASLWQVSDVATAELMKKLYAGMLERRLSPSAALRAAQLAMSKDPRWGAPYFWAGFVLQGDWK
jgi:CHAT domain-containing protein